MSIFADIQTLEETVQRLIAASGTGIYPGHARFTETVLEALLQLLEDTDPAELSAEELTEAVADLLDGAFPGLEDAALQAIQEQLGAIIEQTNAFYQNFDVETAGVLQSARRTEAATSLATLLRRQMEIARDSLKDRTIQRFQEAIARGALSQKALRQQLLDDMQEDSQSMRHMVETQVVTSTAAYNQLYRNTLARSAGLEHFYYFGTIIANTRPFCRATIDRVYTATQIDLMRNGMLEPVKAFHGGWRCRHSFIGLSVEWDDELRGKLATGGPQQIEISTGRFITIIGTEDRATRLRTQISLTRTEGFDQFIDARTNDSGFVAIHPDWRDERDRYKFEEDNYIAKVEEQRAAEILSQRGDEAWLNPSIPNISGDPADLVWTIHGQTERFIMDVKTPVSFTHRTLSRQLRKTQQSDYFIIQLDQPVPMLERALGSVYSWLDRNPGKRVWLINRYNDNELIEVTRGQAN